VGNARPAHPTADDHDPGPVGKRVRHAPSVGRVALIDQRAQQVDDLLLARGRGFESAAQLGEPAVDVLTKIVRKSRISPRICRTGPDVA
jgi:hypothetical protein